MMGGFIYIMTNKLQGTLYVGVTSNLSRRVWEHREGVVDGFTKQYGLKRLVHYEFHDEIGNAGRPRPDAGAGGAARRAAAVHLPRLLFHLRGSPWPARAGNRRGNRVRRNPVRLEVPGLRDRQDQLPTVRG